MSFFDLAITLTLVLHSSHKTIGICILTHILLVYLGFPAPNATLGTLAGTIFGVGLMRNNNKPLSKLWVLCTAVTFVIGLFNIYIGLGLSVGLNYIMFKRDIMFYKSMGAIVTTVFNFHYIYVLAASYIFYLIY